MKYNNNTNDPPELITGDIEIDKALERLKAVGINIV